MGAECSSLLSVLDSPVLHKHEVTGSHNCHAAPALTRASPTSLMLHASSPLPRNLVLHTGVVLTSALPFSRHGRP